jgi:hypothetical protein
MTPTRMKSGYRVIARYEAVREDRRPLADYDFTPAGLRQATTYALELGRFSQRRSSLFNDNQLEDDDFTAVVREYQLDVRDILAASPQAPGPRKIYS